MEDWTLHATHSCTPQSGVVSHGALPDARTAKDLGRLI
jgi:hypothetical protein